MSSMIFGSMPPLSASRLWAYHLRAVEPGHHGWGRGAALAGDRFVVGLFLVLVHFARRKQLQPHVGFLLFFNRCDVRDAGSRSTIISCKARARARDILNFTIRPLRSAQQDEPIVGR